MKLPILLASSAACLLAASAQADAPTAAGPRIATAATASPGTKGTVYGDLPIGVFSDDYDSTLPPPKVAPLPSHLTIRNSDGNAMLSDKSNPDGFSPRTPLMSCLSDGNQLQAARPLSADGGGNHGIRSIQLVESENGATLISDSILLRGGMPAGAFHHGSMSLKKLETVAGGLTVYGARDERKDHRYVHFVVKPPQAKDLRNINAFPAMLFSTDGRFQSMHGCGFVLVSLPLKPDTATTAQVRVNTVLATNDIEPVQIDGEVRIGGPQGRQREITLRPVAVAFSASQLGSDREPRVSISAAWKGDETTQRVFVPTLAAPTSVEKRHRL